jgi:ATP-dependent Clp protease ATP-binding subunit ClpA
MQREIEDKLAQLLLAGKVTDGSLVKADLEAKSGGLVISAD